MQRVIIESPYAGDVEENTSYARACMRDCLERGEAPYASHLLYTQPGVLDDDDPDERAQGIEAGLCWGEKAEKTVVYVDRGISKGMMQGIDRAHKSGREIVFRSLESGEQAAWDEEILFLMGPREESTTAEEERTRLDRVVRQALDAEDL